MFWFNFLTDEKLFGSTFTIKITILGDCNDFFYSFVSCDERFGKPDTHICDRNSVPRHTSSYASITETKKYIKYSKQHLVSEHLMIYTVWFVVSITNPLLMI